MKNLTPVVFLAFANDMSNHLAMLKQESRDIYNTLRPLEDEGSIQIHREESASVDELYKDLVTYNDRLVIFHYAGHADGTMLQLEDGDGSASGIASLLGQQNNLQLVFLNGCATRDQVRLLHKAGVPAVIGTSVKINDNKASQFSLAYYAALSAGQNIDESFESAKNFLDSKFGNDSQQNTIMVSRHPVFDFEDEEPAFNEFEWSMFYRQDRMSDTSKWRLQDAKTLWHLVLEDRDGSIKDFDDKPLQIIYPLRRRQIEHQHCNECSSLVQLKRTTSEPLGCPMCGASNWSAQDHSVLIPDQRLDFVVDTKKALEIAQSAVATYRQHSNEQELSFDIQRLFIPYWSFNVDVRMIIEAEKGTIQNIQDANFNINWEQLNEQVDLSLHNYLVLGTHLNDALLQGIKGESESGYWSVDSPTRVQDLDLDINALPLDIILKNAFKYLQTHLEEEQEQCLEALVSGLQRRNVKCHIRYRNLQISSVLLPHYVCRKKPLDSESEQLGQSVCLLINGQTGTYTSANNSNKLPLTQRSNCSMNQPIGNGDRDKPSYKTSIFSGIGIGLMVGLLLGLAADSGPQAKSVVSIFIGAVGVVLAALLGLNDKYFSTAKGLRIGSFGLAVCLSALGGIYIRDHGLLSPPLKERVEQVRKALPKLSDQQIAMILSKDDVTKLINNQSNDADINAQAPLGRINLASVAYSEAGVSRTICEKLRSPYDADASADDVLKIFRTHDDKNEWGWKRLADRVESGYPKRDIKPMLHTARDAACGFEFFDAVRPDDQMCLKIKDENPQKFFDAIKGLSNGDKLISRVESSISDAYKPMAYQDLLLSLCGGSYDEIIYPY